MCSEGGTDSSVSNEVSDSATESTAENNDSATELYEDVDDVDDNLVYNEPQQVISQNNDEEFDYTWLKIITFLIFI